MDKQNNTKGLAGLSSMITDVQAIEQHAQSQSAREQTNARNKDESETIQSPAGLQIDQSSHYQQESSNYGQQAKRRDRLIALGLGVVLLLFFLFGAGGGKSNTSLKSQSTRNTTTTKPSTTYSTQSAPKLSPKPTPTPAPKPTSESLPTPSLTPAPKPTAVQKTPVQVLQAFHQNITNKRYREAYNYLSEDFQDSVSYEGWAPGFRTTISSTVSNVKTVSQTDNQVVLTYTLKAVDYPGGTRYFQGTATFIKTSDGWKIDEITNKAL